MTPEYRAWAQSLDKPTLNPVLEQFWWTPARIKVLYGGRSSSKSWDAAAFAIFLAQSCKVKFLCTRQFQARIEDSVYTLLKSTIERFKLGHKFSILKNKIICVTTGSEFVFYGLWRSIDEIKGLEGVNIHWCEEAHMLTKAQWEIIRPTIRAEGSQHWIIFNPKLATDFVWREFVLSKDPRVLKRQINYTENPFISQTMLDDIETIKISDPDGYNLHYLGIPQDNDDESIIKRSWLYAAVDAHAKLGINVTGQPRLGFDLADSGADACALVESRGGLTYWASAWHGKTDRIDLSAKRAWERASERGATLIYDHEGMGAWMAQDVMRRNAEAKAKDGSFIPVLAKGFRASGAIVRPQETDPVSKVKNIAHYENAKAQAWGDCARKLFNTFRAVELGIEFKHEEMLFFSSELEDRDTLFDEISSPKSSTSLSGKWMVERKKDMIKRGISSPNLADAWIMANMSKHLLNTGSVIGGA